MAVLQVKNDIYQVGVRDWDRRLFDQLVPLPHGTSYNSYLIKGCDKTALIDTVYPPKKDELIFNLKSLNVEKLDYIISLHSEQDHSGCIKDLLEIYPDAKILTNAKCKDLLINHHHIDCDKISEVDNSIELALGNKTIKFMLSPWVHWPDTMFAHIPEDKIIFTTDFMGSHLATSDLFSVNEAQVYEAAKRYYAEIMMPFRSHVKKYTEQLRNMDLDMIAPSHGPIHNRPEFIIDAYADWSSDEVKGEVIIPYVSMYGSTTMLVNALTDKLIEKGIKVTPFNLIETDLGELAVSLVDATTIVFGVSMVLAGPHPAVVYGASLVSALRPKAKFISAVGSYGWMDKLGGAMIDQLRAIMPNVKAEAIDSVVVKGKPSEEDLNKLDKLVDDIYNKHQEAMK